LKYRLGRHAMKVSAEETGGSSTRRKIKRKRNENK
jgi:hypothetical protein